MWYRMLLLDLNIFHIYKYINSQIYILICNGCGGRLCCLKSIFGFGKVTHGCVTTRSFMCHRGMIIAPGVLDVEAMEKSLDHLLLCLLSK